jgi:hypothetical protein
MFFLRCVAVLVMLVLLLLLHWPTILPAFCYCSFCIGVIVILMWVLLFLLCWCYHFFHIGAAILFALVFRYNLAQPLLLFKYVLAQPFLLFSHWCHCFFRVGVIFVPLVSLVLHPLLPYVDQCLEHQINQ